MNYLILAAVVFFSWSFSSLFSTFRISFYCQRIILAGSDSLPMRVSINYSNLNGKILYQVNLVGVQNSRVLAHESTIISALKKSLRNIENH